MPKSDQFLQTMGNSGQILGLGLLNVLYLFKAIHGLPLHRYSLLISPQLFQTIGAYISLGMFLAQVKGA